MAPLEHPSIYVRNARQEEAGQRAFIIACSLTGTGVLLTVIIFIAGYIWHYRLGGRRSRLLSHLKPPREATWASAGYDNNRVYELPDQLIKLTPCVFPLKSKQPDTIHHPPPLPPSRSLQQPNPPSFHNRSLPGFQWKRKCPPKLEPLPEAESFTHTTVREFDRTLNRPSTFEHKEYDPREFRGSLDELSTVSNHLNLSTGLTRTVLAHTYSDDSCHFMDNAIPSPSLYFSASVDVESLVFPLDAKKTESCLLSRSRTKSSSVILLPGSSPESKKGAITGSKPLRVTPSIISRWRRVRDMADYQSEEPCSSECATSPVWSDHCSVPSSLRMDEKTER
ncbi:hypothetical protein MGYG_00858 [Nannizzia gypsea CBS 118893]|uniref:Uncharacterized protein n=1 Tax=Arthroderma gypseum (strain ATCC MYA-4604 / CBS 118893) TaxID=535722 RepID=E5R2E6_ARTGP|nr:hypothetical protein MGYG_00858 [Nannizzia gypsea CBS 118893]EFQ97822.1 hypothetical protein MGYG_00858 [Nannizzia gypsea CBS 118893]